MEKNNEPDWIIRMKLTEEIRRFSTLYIQKTASGSDKRSYYLKLTPKGHDTLRSAYLYYIEPLKILEDKLGAEHFKTLFQLIALANK